LTVVTELDPQTLSSVVGGAKKQTPLPAPRPASASYAAVYDQYAQKRDEVCVGIPLGPERGELGSREDECHFYRNRANVWEQRMYRQRADEMRASGPL
jgi:hypothetical protein